MGTGTEADDLSYSRRTTADRGGLHVSRISTVSVLMALALTAGVAAAEPARTLKVTQSVDIAAPVDKVWDAIKNFDSLDKWHPGFASDQIVKGSNNQVGAVRKLTVKDGPSFEEELLAFDESAHSYRYRIIESPLPLRDYVSRITVKPGAKGGSHVTWTGSFKRKSTSDNPPEGENDAAALKLINSVYQGGLSNLKKMLGS
jgi:mxaD protein